MLKHRTWLMAAGLIGLTLLAYIPAIQGGWLWDDDTYVTGDERLRTLRGLWEIWFQPTATYRHQWYPLTMTGFWLQVQLFGLNPMGFKIVNVLLHAGNGLMLWRVMRRLRVPGGEAGAYLIGLVFAVHPVAVMSVAWVTELKNTLSGFFFLGTVLAYLRFAKIGAEEDAETARPWLWYALACGLFVLALASKTATASLPVGVAAILWWKRPGGKWLSRLWPLVPLALAGLGMVLLTKHFEQHFTGASGETWSHTPAQKIVLCGQALWFYAGKLVWPHPLVFFYERWQVDAQSMASWFAPAGVLAVLAVLFALRNRIGRGAFAASLFFCIAVGPMYAINVYMMRYTWVADHWQYWAMMGLLGLIVGVVVAAARRWLPTYRYAGPALAGLLVAALGACTWVRGCDYRDIETLWQVTIADNPTAYAAYGNLGNLYLEQGRYEEALPNYERAFELTPGPDKQALRLNLGKCLLRLRRPDEAAGHLEALIEAEPENVEARSNLGLAYQSMNRPGDAANQFARALELDDKYVPAIVNYGGLLCGMGRFEDGISQFERALELDENNFNARSNLGSALQQLGRYEEAVAYLERALQLRPDEPEVRFSLGMALHQLGQLDEAVAHLEQVLRARPDHLAARHTLGYVLQDMGEDERAIEQFAEVIKAQPGNVAPLIDTAISLERLGRGGEAAETYERALSLAGDDVFVLTRFAWLLATCGDDAVRDGARAVELAGRAVRATDWRSAEPINVLAAAYAETGQFDAATELQRKAIDLVGEARRGDYERRLEGYLRKEPHREPAWSGGGAGSGASGSAG